MRAITRKRDLPGALDRGPRSETLPSTPVYTWKVLVSVKETGTERTGRSLWNDRIGRQIDRRANVEVTRE